MVVGMTDDRPYKFNGIMVLRQEPFLIDNKNLMHEQLIKKTSVNDFANASFMSSVFWLWKNPCSNC